MNFYSPYPIIFAASYSISPKGQHSPKCRIKRADNLKISLNKKTGSTSLAVNEIYSDEEDEKRDSSISLFGANNFDKSPTPQPSRTEKQRLDGLREKHSTSKMKGKSDLKKHDAGRQTSSTYL